MNDTTQKEQIKKYLELINQNKLTIKQINKLNY
jgi:hypothetical protein